MFEKMLRDDELESCEKKEHHSNIFMWWYKNPEKSKSEHTVPQKEIYTKTSKGVRSNDVQYWPETKKTYTLKPH
jgi:hypothetical protein